jgi:hypothetical protein
VNLGVHYPVSLPPFSIRTRDRLEFSSLPAEQAPRSGALQDGGNAVLNTQREPESAQDLLDSLDPVFDGVLNVISFRLLRPVTSMALEIVEDKPQTEEREAMLVPGYSPLAQVRLGVFGFGFRGGIQTRMELTHERRVDVALRWFLQGMTAWNPVDAFGCYWLAIESLATSGDL